MEQKVNFEELSRDPAFIKALSNCASTEDAQKLFASKQISLSGETLLEACLNLLKCGKMSGALSEEDLLQVAAGTSDRITNHIIGESEANAKISRSNEFPFFPGSGARVIH